MINAIFKTQSVRKPTGSPIFKRRYVKKQSLTPDQRHFQMKKYDERHEKLPLIQPMSSVEFREMISKRRILMSENSYL